jgi:hypothetical protein
MKNVVFSPNNIDSRKTVARTLLALASPMLVCCVAFGAHAAGLSAPATPAKIFPLSSVRLLPGPFADAVQANREYLLALEPDRLLAPYLREAGLPAKAKSYENWESGGLDGHTAGHYLSALATMIAAGADTPERFHRWLCRRRSRQC